MVKTIDPVINNDVTVGLLPDTNTIRTTNDIPEGTITIPTTNSHRDYVQRRMQMWEGAESGDSDYEHIKMGAIARLPLPLQVAFRRKMLVIFEMQLLIVWIVVGIFRFAPKPKQWAEDVFHPIGMVVASFVIAIVLLVLLYFIRNQFPFNWGLLVLFSVAQSACGVGLGVVVDTNVGFFNCAFTFTSVLIMLLLAGVYRHPTSSQMETTPSPDVAHISVTIDANQALTTEAESQEGALLSTFYAGMIAYVIVALLATVLYFATGDKLVTKEAFVITLVFQFALLLWFSWDASSMYRVMSPDEYMHGVIYLYTDLILLVMISALAVSTVVVCLALCDGGGGDCDCGGCYCGGCSGDCDCCTSSSSQQSTQEEENGAMDAQMDRV